MKKIKNSERGFLKIIIILVIILLIAAFMGFNPVDVWDKLIEPLITIIWKIVVFLYELIIKIFKSSGQSLADLIALLQKLVGLIE